MPDSLLATAAAAAAAAAARLVFSFCEAVAKTAWRLASPSLWLGLAIAYAVTHLTAALLTGCGHALNGIVLFLDDLVSVVLSVINVVAEVVSKAGNFMEDLVTLHWDRLGHEGGGGGGGGPAIRKPMIFEALARATSDGGGDGSGRDEAFIPALGRSIRLWSEGGNSYCSFLDYCESISLTRWTVARPLTGIFPGLCDDDEEAALVATLSFVFEDFPILLRWIGTTGVVLFLALVTCHPLTVWLVGRAVSILKAAAKATLRVIWKKIVRRTARRRLNSGALCCICLEGDLALAVAWVSFACVHRAHRDCVAQSHGDDDDDNVCPLCKRRPPPLPPPLPPPGKMGCDGSQRVSR